MWSSLTIVLIEIESPWVPVDIWGKKIEEVEKAEFVVYMLDMDKKTSFLNKIKVFYFGCPLSSLFFLSIFMLNLGRNWP